MRNLSELQEVYERADESLVCLEKLLTGVENECPSFFSAPVSNMSASEMLAIARDLLKIREGTRYLYVDRTFASSLITTSSPRLTDYQLIKGGLLRVWRIYSDKVVEVGEDGVHRRVEVVK